MDENVTLAEIRHTRDEHARECGYDVHTIFEQMRAETAQLQAGRWKVVSPGVSGPTVILREEPPKA